MKWNRVHVGKTPDLSFTCTNRVQERDESIINRADFKNGIKVYKQQFLLAYLSMKSRKYIYLRKKTQTIINNGNS